MMSAAKKKIFLVEDDEAIIDVMQIVLQQAGCLSIAASKQEDLFSQILRIQPDTIFLDLHYQQMHIPRLINALQTNEQTAHISLIIVSADNGIEKIAMQTHVAGFLRKPFSIDELVMMAKKHT